MGTVEAELPKYVCHKQVHALKIDAVVALQGGGARLFPAEAGYAPIDVTADWVQKRSPTDGGYYVVYEDGYKSFSPAEAFEQGYSRAGLSQQAEAGMSWKMMAASAYKAYAASTGNKNFRGEPMPEFDALPVSIRTAWEAAARQVGDCRDARTPPDESRWAGWLPP